MKRYEMTLAAMLLTLIPSSALAVDAPSALVKFKQLSKDESKSYERLLSRAWPIAEAAFVAQKWGDVEKSLTAAGASTVASPRQRSSDFRCVVLPNAFTTSSGIKLDLFLDFAISEGRSLPSYTVPPENTVGKVSVGLSATVLAPHEQVRREQWFGRGTLIEEALADWPVQKAQAEFPDLESLALVFGEVWDANTDEERPGYRLQLLLVKGMGEKKIQRRLECSSTISQLRDRGREPVGGWTSRDFWPSGAAASLAVDLRRILKDNEPSYQLLLHKATHFVRKAALDREWSAVSRELDGQGLKLIAENTWQYGKDRKYLVAEKAFTTSGGQNMDLFVNFSIVRETSKTAPTREIVEVAYAGFSAEVGTTFAQALSEHRFGKATAIQKVLLHEDAAQAAKECPFLKTVEVYYDVIRDHRLNAHSWGFFVRPDLISAKGDESASARLHFSIGSGLDPLESEGTTLLVKDFVPKNTLGDPFCHGGSSSGTSKSQREEPSHFYLAKRGAAQGRNFGDRGPKPAIAYSLGDLKSLPADTLAISVESKEIYDDDLATAARFTELRDLNLGPCEGVTDAGLEHLAGLKKLESLTLSGELLSGKGFSNLGTLPKLTELKLYSSKRITDEGVAALAEMSQLTRLSLHGAGALTDAQVAQLSKLSALRALNIWGCRDITDAGLQHIAKLASLEELTFSHSTRITSSGIAHLTGLKNLKELSVGYVPLADDAMLPLSRIESLEYLTLRGLEIKGQGVQVLGRLPRLTSLRLDGCKGVTEQDVKQLKASLKGDFELRAY